MKNTVCPIQVLEQFKLDNPNLELNIFAENLPFMSDGVRMSVQGIAQPHPAFEHGVIERMKQTIPGNTMSGHKTKRQENGNI
jgi:hypothetical protein